jgi:hypothetical protein
MKSFVRSLGRHVISWQALGGRVGRLTGIVVFIQSPFLMPLTQQAGLAAQTQASVSFFQTTCSVSGKTRVPAMEVMKLVSPGQRGSTCKCR